MSKKSEKQEYAIKKILKLISVEVKWPFKKKSIFLGGVILKTCLYMHVTPYLKIYIV